MKNDSELKTEDQSSTNVQDKNVSQPCSKPNVIGSGSKVRTYRFTKDTGCDIVDTSLDNTLECLKIEIEEDEFDGEPIEYKIIVEEKYTQKELEEMGEFEGF